MGFASVMTIISIAALVIWLQQLDIKHLKKERELDAKFRAAGDH
jgi:hypothetical protein